MSRVTRSVFQKKCEETKRLLHDIRLLVSDEETEDKVKCKKKWQEHFKGNDWLVDILKETAEDYFKNKENK